MILWYFKTNPRPTRVSKGDFYAIISSNERERVGNLIRHAMGRARTQGGADFSVPCTSPIWHPFQWTAGLAAPKSHKHPHKVDSYEDLVRITGCQYVWLTELHGKISPGCQQIQIKLDGSILRLKLPLESIEETCETIVQRLDKAEFPAWDRTLLVEDQESDTRLYLAGSWLGGCT